MLPLALSACLSSGTESAGPADGFDAISAAAKSEGTVTWYTTIPQQVATAAAEGFTKEYGLKVDMIVLNSGTLTTRFSKEMDSGSSPADVVTMADPVFFSDAVKQGWVAKFRPKDTPSLQPWPTSAVRENAYALVNIQPVGVTINTKVVNEQELRKQSWKYLLNPSLKDRIYLVDPENVQTWLAHMKLLRDTYGGDFLRQLGRQQPKIVDSAVPGGQQLAAGSGALVYPGLLSVSNPLQAKGAPLKTVFLNPTTGVPQYAALSSRAPHPNIARLFLNYLLTERAQKIINAKTGSSPLGDLAGTVPLPPGYVPPDQLIPAAVRQKSEIMSELGLK
ncbi:ABC transporter substrate-binding protein [Actinomadura sp. LOL_016]|uniref:ABC transporter substrate-binding protein n=1 Tax=unclassified Actinomadura TaxID=2626254 RepID=UPI003A808DCB